jgi:hypothetical protein
MYNYKKIVYSFSLILFSLFFNTSFATPTGIKLDKINYDNDTKKLTVTICNWDSVDKDLGDYQLQLNIGTKKKKKTFVKGYILNYSCGQSIVDIEELGLTNSGNISVKIRFETIAGKKKEEKQVSINLGKERRFEVSKDPHTDLIVKKLTFNENTRTITAELCNKGDNYRINHKQYMSTEFAYNNFKSKSIYFERNIWAGSCWKQEINIKKLKISKSGDYMVEVHVDAGNAVTEKGFRKSDTSKEDNNLKQIRFSISEPPETFSEERDEEKIDFSKLSIRERIMLLRKDRQTNRQNYSSKTMRKTQRRRSKNYKKRRVNPFLKMRKKQSHVRYPR